MTCPHLMGFTWCGGAHQAPFAEGTVEGPVLHDKQQQELQDRQSVVLGPNTLHHNRNPK